MKHPKFPIQSYIADAQAVLEVVGISSHPKHGFVYEVVTPGAFKEPWLVPESFLNHCEIISKKKGEAYAQKIRKLMPKK